MKRRLPYFETRLQRLAAVGMALLWLAMAVHGALRKSPVFDEPPHIADAFAILRYGDYRMNPEHPPLFKIVSALPAWFFARPTIDLETNESLRNVWRVEYANLWGYWTIYMLDAPHARLMFLCRIVPILTGLLGGWLAFLWGREFAGPRCGLLAAALLMFYPEYLGHARFLTLDVANLTACSAVVWFGWRCLRRATAMNIAAFILVCTIASLVKLPATMTVFVVWSMIGLSAFLAARRRKGRAPAPVACMTLRRFAATTLLLACAGTFGQWAVAGFRVKLESAHYPRAQESRFLLDENWNSTFLRAMKPLRAMHLLPDTTFAVLGHTGASQGRPVFLLSDKSYEGWYKYFAVTTALKTPFLHIALLAPAAWYVASRMRRGRRLERERLAFVLVPFAVLLTVTVLSRLNIGHRHVMFIYLPWAIFAAAGVERFARHRDKARRFGAPLVGLVAVAICVGAHPNQETYFNPIVGTNPLMKSHYLADSNIDWGEDLVAAADAVVDMGFASANVAYFGMGRPEAYGIDPARQILPNYPYAIRLEDDAAPDPRLPTIVSLNAWDSVMVIYPGLLTEDPVAICNSILVYPPNPAWSPGKPRMERLMTPEDRATYPGTRQPQEAGP